MYTFVLTYIYTHIHARAYAYAYANTLHVTYIYIDIYIQYHPPPQMSTLFGGNSMFDIARGCYVDMYVYIYIYVYTHMHVYVHVWLCVSALLPSQIQNITMFC